MRAALLLALALGGAAVAAVPPPSTALAFRASVVPADLASADTAGEPSLGFTRDGELLYMANTATFRVAGDTWTDVTAPLVGLGTADPLLWSDPLTGRTFVSQLQQAGGSLQAYTDDGGRTWTNSPLGSPTGPAFDHPTITTGPPPPGSPLQPVGYPDLLYSCTQDVVATDCGVSVDGGLTYLPAHPAYPSELTTGTCATFTGHLKADQRDGTLYLPPDGCAGAQGLFVSRDAATTWSFSGVPGSTDGDGGHPSVGVGRDSSVWFAYGSGDGALPGRDRTGRVHVVVSRDHAATWSAPAVLGADLGLRTARFPVVVAGDTGRAAVAFLGSRGTGLPNAGVDPAVVGPVFTGTWSLYVSLTLDGGRTWQTRDALPGNVFQRGPICSNNLACSGGGRNLLEFIDLVLDPDGRLALAVADGAPGPRDTWQDGHARATVVRQVAGPSLYATTATPVRRSAPAPRRTVTGPSLPASGLSAVVPLLALGVLAVSLAARRSAARRPRG